MKKLLLFSAFLMFTFFLSVMNTSSQIHLRAVGTINYEASNNYNGNLAESSSLKAEKQPDRYFSIDPLR